MNKSYLTPKQVADQLMVSPTAVRQWAEKGDLKALTTPGGHRRFLPREVERFARERGLTLNIDTHDELRVLIIDDDKLLSEYLMALLDGFQDEVTAISVNDSFDAGLKIKEFEPHVVLLDIMMPGLNGFQVCEMLKKSPETKGIRVIAMTGSLSKDNVEKILASGAEACLAKPIDEALLMKHLGIKYPQTK